MTVGPVGESPSRLAPPEIPCTGGSLPAVFDAVAVGIVLHSLDGSLLASNVEAQLLLAGVPVSVLSNAVATVAAQRKPRSFTITTPLPDGTPRRLLVTAIPQASISAAGPDGVVSTLRDLAPDDPLKRPHRSAPLPRSAGDDDQPDSTTLRNALALTERQLAAVTRTSPIGAALITPSGTILKTNRSFLRMTGHPATQSLRALTGKELSTLIDPADRTTHDDLLRALVAGERDSYELELRLIRADSGTTWVRLSAGAVHDPAGGVLHVALQTQDITEARTALARLTHQTLHDPLTGLPNRTLCSERIQQAISRAHRRNRRAAVLLCDLDHFRVVNDSVGLAVGDQVLITVAQRLRESLSDEVTVARLTGDEFAIVAEVCDASDAMALARHLIGTVARPVELAGRTIVPSVGVGVALSSASEHVRGEGDSTGNTIADGDPVARLIQDASTALHQAKRSGRGSIVFSDHELRASTQSRLEIESQLRNGVLSGQMRLHLQNIVDLRDGTVVGREALVRWQHPQRGLLAPGHFLPIAEESGLIQDLGRWVIAEAARIAVGTTGPGYIAINVSPSQVRHPGLADQIEQALECSGLSPERLVVELTESVMLDAAQQARDQLQRLDDLGVRIVVDDFGTGFSALSHLRDLPVSGIKIDRSFTQGLGIDRHCDRIVEALTGLAGGLGVDLVAEGVETQEQAGMLTDIGCLHAQGFLFGKPHPVQIPLP